MRPKKNCLSLRRRLDIKCQHIYEMLCGALIEKEWIHSYYNSWKYPFEDIWDAIKGNPLPLISVVTSAAAFGYALWVALR